jgi:magnesium-transporting ATPase (P-type)
MTYVFQIFVFMQVFNQINARILTESFNIFTGICRNWLFLAVTIFTFVIQMVMVEVGGKVVKTAPLEMYQNGICLCIGAGELIWGVFIKFLPVRFFQCFNFEERPMTKEETEASTLGKFKSGSSALKPKSAAEINDAVGSALVQQFREIN